MISLGSVTLHDNLIWENRDNCPRNAYSRRVTLNGRVIVQHSHMDGRLVQLSTVSVRGGTIGYFTYEQIQVIRAYENNMSVVSFVYGGETLQVIIQPGGLMVEPVVPRPNPENADWYLGTINLIEIGV